MSYQEISYDVDRGAALITLQRPEKLSVLAQTGVSITVSRLDAVCDWVKNTFSTAS